MNKITTLEEFYKKGNKYRWKGKSKKERVEHAKMMVEAKKKKQSLITPNK